MRDIEAFDEPFLLTDEVRSSLRVLALSGYPYEVCGLIHSHNIIHQYQNTYLGDTMHGFDMEVDIHNDIKAIWHSHPNGPDCVSDDDLRGMEALASQGFSYPWIIVTPYTVTAWHFKNFKAA